MMNVNVLNVEVLNVEALKLNVLTIILLDASRVTNSSNPPTKEVAHVLPPFATLPGICTVIDNYVTTKNRHNMTKCETNCQLNMASRLHYVIVTRTEFVAKIPQGMGQYANGVEYGITPEVHKTLAGSKMVIEEKRK